MAVVCPGFHAVMPEVSVLCWDEPSVPDELLLLEFVLLSRINHFGQSSDCYGLTAEFFLSPALSLESLVDGSRQAKSGLYMFHNCSAL